MDSRVAADRVRRDSHVATHLAFSHTFAHNLALDVAPAGDASISHLHAWRNLRCRSVVPDRLAVHTRHHAHAGFRDALHAGPALRHDTDLFTGMAMFAGCTAVSGTAAASATSAPTSRAAAAGIAIARKALWLRCLSRPAPIVFHVAVRTSRGSLQTLDQIVFECSRPANPFAFSVLPLHVPALHLPAATHASLRMHERRKRSSALHGGCLVRLRP